MNINDIIREELQYFNERHQDIFTITDLAGIMKRMGFEQQSIDALFNILLQAFKSGGDNAVIDMYKRMTGVEIEAISRGRYMFKKLVTPQY